MSDSYRIKLSTWRESRGQIIYQTDIYRPGSHDPSTSPIDADRAVAIKQAHDWIAADRGETLPEPEWIEVP